MSGACGRAARDGRGTRGQGSGQGQIQGYRTDAKKSIIKKLDYSRVIPPAWRENMRVAVAPRETERSTLACVLAWYRK